MKYLKGKKILIAGACGTVGLALVRELLAERSHAPRSVIGIDNNETGLFYLDQHYLGEQRAQFFVTDIRDRESLRRHMRGVDIVFHTAALKHIVLCERSPFDAVQTNIHGVQNIVTAAGDAGVEKVIFTSSDKAVNPASVMGISKLMGERIVTAAAAHRSNDGPVFASTRFGNVLGSSGSVIPVFRRQIAAGGPLTLTDPGMRRFAMSVEQAVNLILDSARVAHGGEVFVTKMPVIRIEDLATVMIGELAPVHGYDPGDIEVREIGVKPGEKLCEELMSREETPRAVELERYFVILPAFRDLHGECNYRYENLVRASVNDPYVAVDQPAMERGELKDFLYTHGLLDPHAVEPSYQPDNPYRSGDKEESRPGS